MARKNTNYKLVTIEWNDITAEDRADKEKVMNTPIKDLFMRCKTHGRIIREDEDGIILEREDSEDQIDYVAIPKKTIIRRH